MLDGKKRTIAALSAILAVAARGYGATTYGITEKAGYDQLPCGSIWADEKNFGALVPFCRKRIGRERLKGYLMAPWLATLEANRVKLMKAVDIAAAAFTTAE